MSITNRLIKFSIVFFTYLIGSGPLSGQIAKGTWRDHLPYNTAHTVAATDDKVYCAAEKVMFYYDLNDHSVNRMSKTSGISDLGIGTIAFSKEYNCLVVGYTNGNIDIFKNNKKYNIPDLKEKNMLADKQINHISFNEDKAYLSCGFGIIVLNIDKLEVSDTYLLGSNSSYVAVQASMVFENEIYALTADGILKGDLDEPFLSYYEKWVKDTSVNHPNSDFFSCAIFNDKLFVVGKYDYNNTDTTTETKYVLQAYSNNTWEVMIDTLPIIKSITSDNNRLLLVERWHVFLYNSNLERIKHYPATYGQQAVFGNDDYVYVADSKDGLLIKHPSKPAVQIAPDGPISDLVFAMGYTGNEILVAPGGYERTGASSFTKAEIYSFKNNVWGGFDSKNSPLIKNVRDVVSFATQKSNSNSYYAVSFAYGLIEVQNNEITEVYTPENTDSVLNQFITGATYDNSGNLWLICSGTDKPFVVKTHNSNWYSYSYGGQWGNILTDKVIYTSSGDFWTISTKGEGFFVWNDNYTPETDADDTYKKFELIDDEASEIADYIYDIVEDNEGAIWFATSNGVAVIDNPHNALNGDPLYARTPYLVIDGYLKPLLEGETVTSIAVDGANRKWIGTAGGGLFLVSGDGTKQIFIFNESNSALLSNKINALEINQKTGELFIGTDKGIMSYMTTSSGGNNSYTNIYAFPNPVKGEYDGLITVRGLIYESEVKITDLSGKIVFKTESNGGDAIWNGRDFQGNKVSSGIYLVFCTNPDGSEAEVTKILIVR